MEQPSDVSNPSTASLAPNEAVAVQYSTAEADTMSDASQTMLPANGYGNPLQHSDFNSSTMSLEGVPRSITSDEIALYDRQIRLWGVQAQEKLRAARILIVGMRGLANEIAKNLVLAGVGYITVVDDGIVTEDDLGSQFFISEEHIGQNRAEAALPQIQKLNPRVSLKADHDSISSKPPEYFAIYDVTIATCLDIDTLSMINASCRIANRKFYAADTHGMYGYVFVDLIVHDFVIERTKSNKATDVNKAETMTRIATASTTKRENGKVIEMVSKRELYSPIILANTSPLPAEITSNRRRRLHITPLLSCLRALFDFQKVSAGRLPSHSRPDLELFTSLATEKHRELLLPTETLRSDFLRSFLQNLGSQIIPVAAFVGGSLAQDVINVLGQREQPLQNFLLFDGEEFKGPIYSLHPFFPETLTVPGLTAPTNGKPMINHMGAGLDVSTNAPSDVAAGSVQTETR